MIDFAAILRSPPFKLLLGKDHTCLTIPKSLAKGISDPLHAMMNNEHMIEAQNDLALMDDVEADTFVGFCEFAYTGDYRSRMMELAPEIQSNGPAPIEIEEIREVRAVEWDESPPDAAPEAASEVVDWIEPLKDELPSEPAEDYWGFKRAEKTVKKKKPKHEQLWTDFLNLTYEKRPSLVSNEQPISVNSDNASASETTISLLYHAKIYVFAEKYLIDDLRILSLRKLHDDLRDFDLTLQTSGLILEVLEFTYAKTERKELSDDELRMLVVHYASCKGEVLMQNAHLRSLLEDNGEMACDLLYKNWGDSL